MVRPPVRPPGRPSSFIVSKPPQSSVPPTTVYVGRIPADVDDDFLKPLIELCGPISKWTRLSDPQTGKKKSFAFCEFGNPLSALRALRIINDLEIDDGKLLVNVDSKTQETLDKFQENTNKSSQTAQGNASTIHLSRGTNVIC